MRSEMTWAWSDGGPGLNSGLQTGGKSTLITGASLKSDQQYGLTIRALHSPKNPELGAARSGSATWAVIPQSRAVSPSLTRALPSAVEMDP